MQSPLELREETFWFHRDGKPLFPGHPDRVLVYDDWLVVFDYKFGYQPVAPADGNFQLRAYLCQVSEKYPRNHYYAAIFQPRCWPQLHSVVYTPEDIVLARKEISDIWDACHDPKAKLFPSPDACKHCRAKLCCSALQGIPAMLNRQLKLKDPVSVIQKMSPEKRTALFDMAKIAKAYLEDLDEAGKAMLQKDPGAIPGWRLKSGGEVRKITQSVEAYRLLHEAGKIDATSFTSAATISIGKLESAVRLFNDTNSKEAEIIVNSICAPVIEKKAKASSLERIS